MDRNELLRNVYEDFFGPNKIEIKPVEKKQQEFSKEISEEDKNKKMQEILEKNEQLNIEEGSKELLKKIIIYAREYSEGKSKQYISFNMCLYTDNKEITDSVIEVLKNGLEYFSYLPQGDATKISFYELEKAEMIEEIYNDNNNILIFESFEAFTSKEQNFKERFLYKLNEKISDNKRTLTILNAKNKEELREVFLISEKIKNEFTDFEILGKNPDVQDVYQEILSKIDNSIKLDDDKKIKLLDYISVTYPETSLSYPKYRDDLCEKILFNKAIPEYKSEKSIDEIFAELNNLVGLEKVKKMLKELVSLVELKNKTKDDLKLQNINLHMVFLGNPGTGKTTVARIVAEILYNLKYVKQNKLLEVSSKDLVAEYVGQTAPKTMAVINKAIRRGIIYR